ncbi:hypothetical protein APTSU1_001866300 [Apodemus speciosus]|uniref:Uncharacterized protein n=1 Tax=Apodemus speciosus TaxID=105296 RepID=A0ABQ0FWA4_APOSI
MYENFIYYIFQTKVYKDMDPKDSVIAEWIVENPNYHFPDILSYIYQDGYRINVYTNEQRRVIRVTVALCDAKGTNLTEEMRKEYINLTKMQEIPIENIKNIYVTGVSFMVAEGSVKPWKGGRKTAVLLSFDAY